MTSSRHAKPREFMVIVAALAFLSALYSFESSPGDVVVVFERQRQLEVQEESLNENEVAPDNNEPSPQRVTVCGRVADADDIGSAQDLALQEKYAICPENDPETTPVLVLEGYLTFGRTANQLRTLLPAIQYARDMKYDLAIMYNSWAMDVLLEYFMASTDGSAPWESGLEKALCIKIVREPEELEGRRVVLKNSVELFYYFSTSSQDDLVAGQLYNLRTLFRHHNTGEGHDGHGNQVGNMCSGIDALFGTESRASAVYSIIHLRYMEGAPGRRWLEHAAKETGCDPNAALEMEPDYVKGILAPLDMLNHPIVVITDGQNIMATRRLKADPVIGPNLIFVPPQASWIGGDITLATMATVFIGNPASSFSGFITQSRVSLGFRHNYLFMAKDENGEWINVCDDACISTKTYQHIAHVSMSALVGTLSDKRRIRILLDQKRKEATTSFKLRRLARGPRKGYQGLYRGLRPDERMWYISHRGEEEEERRNLLLTYPKMHDGIVVAEELQQKEEEEEEADIGNKSKKMLVDIRKLKGYHEPYEGPPMEAQHEQQE